MPLPLDANSTQPTLQMPERQALVDRLKKYLSPQDHGSVDALADLIMPKQPVPLNPNVGTMNDQSGLQSAPVPLRQALNGQTSATPAVAQTPQQRLTRAL